MSEEIAMHFFQNKSKWVLSSWRRKIFDIEVDLLFKKGDHDLLAVEVKSLSSSLMDYPRLSSNQVNRLIKAQAALQSGDIDSVAVSVCFVEYEKKIPRQLWFRSLTDFI